MVGNLNFDLFPAIPDNALISKVEIQVDVEASGTASTSATGGVSRVASSGVDAVALVYRQGSPLADIAFAISSSQYLESAIISPLNSSASASDADHYTATQTFDYSGAPINKEDLISLFTSWLVQLDISGGANAQSRSF